MSSFSYKVFRDLKILWPGVLDFSKFYVNCTFELWSDINTRSEGDYKSFRLAQWLTLWPFSNAPRVRSPVLAQGGRGVGAVSGFSDLLPTVRPQEHLDLYRKETDVLQAFITCISVVVFGVLFIYLFICFFVKQIQFKLFKRGCNV